LAHKSGKYDHEEFLPATHFKSGGLPANRDRSIVTIFGRQEGELPSKVDERSFVPPEWSTLSGIY
jgi:hypothetical protein